MKLLAVAALVFAVSCDSSTEPEEEEPKVTQIRLTFGTQAPVTYSLASGEVRNVHIPAGATTVTAQWLKADGTTETIATTTDFTLKVVVTGSGLAWTQASSNTFTGTLTATGTVTNATVTFALFHVAEQHEDFGPVPVTVSSP
jgi:hypothetical protein